MAMTLAREVFDDLSAGADPHCRGAQAQAQSQRSGSDCGAVGCAGAGEIDFRPPAAEYKERSAFAESAALLRALWHSPHRMRVALLASGIVAVVGLWIVGIR